MAAESSGSRPSASPGTGTKRMLAAKGSSGYGYSTETIRFLQVQYERLRLDEGMIRELLAS